MQPLLVGIQPDQLEEDKLLVLEFVSGPNIDVIKLVGLHSRV